MTKKSSHNDKGNKFTRNNHTFKSSSKVYFNDKHYLEIKRRLEVLQVRRNDLESELQAVKICLLSLDKQLKMGNKYNQLLIERSHLVE